LKARLSVLVLLLAPLLAGCYATGHASLRDNPPLEKATGVRKLSGEEIEFAVTGATIVNDTLHAVGPFASIAIPTDSIAQISEHGFSPLKTAGLVIGVAAVAVVTFAIVLVGSLAQIN
jgi:hypothetical protein